MRSFEEIQAGVLQASEINDTGKILRYARELGDRSGMTRVMSVIGNVHQDASACGVIDVSSSKARFINKSALLTMSA